MYPTLRRCSSSYTLQVLEPEDRPVVIADYGSSQGKNSLAPMGVAILRERVGPSRPTLVFHIDAPSKQTHFLGSTPICFMTVAASQ